MWWEKIKVKLLKSMKENNKLLRKICRKNWVLHIVIKMLHRNHKWILTKKESHLKISLVKTEIVLKKYLDNLAIVNIKIYKYKNNNNSKKG